MKVQSRVKARIRAGEPTLGTWLMTGSLAAAEILSGAGFEWVAVDMEHTAMDYRTLEGLTAGIRGAGAEPLVRIEANFPQVIKRVLDCGAAGVIVPLVNSAGEAAAAVGAAKYPPAGFRGVSLGRASGYGYNFQDYFDSINDQVIVVAQIEHYRAVERIEEIVAVEGLDGVFLGPYDLSGSMGIVGQFEHPRMAEARRTVLEAARAAGKAAGLHQVRPDARAVRELVAEGFTFIACGIDTIFLGDGARAMLAELRGEAGAGGPPGEGEGGSSAGGGWGGR